MNRQELARVVAADEKVMPSMVLDLIEAMVADVEAVVAGGGLVSWPRFGTFYARYRKPRMYHTPAARKRANRPGETEDKDWSISLPKWQFVFSPSRYFKVSVAARSVAVLPETIYAGAGKAWRSRIAGAVGLSSIEVSDFAAAILGQIVKTVTQGEEVTLDGFGRWVPTKVPARNRSVQKAGGGRQVIRIPVHTLPIFRRHVDAGAPP